MNDETLISPPGYQPAQPFVYPLLKLQLGAFGLMGVTLPLLLFWAAWWQGENAAALLILSLADILIILFTVLATVVVHEWVHGAVYWLLGYRVTYGFSRKLGAAYAAAFHQFQTRNHNILTALAPLLILTPLGLFLMTLSNLPMQRIGFTIALFNTGGAVGDLYLTWRLLRLPQQTLMYDADVHKMYILLPK